MAPVTQQPKLRLASLWLFKVLIGVVCELRRLKTLGRLGSMAHDQKNRSGPETEMEAEAVNLKSLSIFCH